jgi:hypothetical protein
VYRRLLGEVEYRHVLQALPPGCVRVEAWETRYRAVWTCDAERCVITLVAGEVRSRSMMTRSGISRHCRMRRVSTRDTDEQTRGETQCTPLPVLRWGRNRCVPRARRAPTPCVSQHWPTAVGRIAMTRPTTVMSASRALARPRVMPRAKTQGNVTLRDVRVAAPRVPAGMGKSAPDPPPTTSERKETGDV